MIEIKYSLDEEVSREGDKNALLEHSSTLKECVTTGTVEIFAESNVDTSPYKYPLNKIVIRSNEYKNCISVREYALIIEGHDEFMLNLASNISWDAKETESGINYHSHYDRISFGNYLNRESLDVIIYK